MWRAQFFKPLEQAATSGRERTWPRRYAVSLGAVALATLGRWLLNPLLEDESPWILFYPAVLIAAWYGRVVCGLLATTLSIVIATWLWLTPSGALRIATANGWTNVIAFAALGIFMSGFTELTHRAAESERRLRREREQERSFFEAILSSMTDAFLVLDDGWHYTYVNQVAAAMMRMPREDVLGRVVWDLFPVSREGLFYTELSRSRRERVPVHFEYFYPPYQVWVEIRAYPMGNSTALFAADITARKRVESELAATREKLAEHAQNLEETVRQRTAALQETVGELERFSYTLSHDLRAPLRSMESFSQFVAEDYGDKLDATGHDYLQRIRKAAQRMDALIKDVLIYSKTSRGELKPHSVDLDAVARDIISQYAPLNSSAAHISVRPPLGHVLGNETMLTQVLSNLLQNAVKFVKPGEKPEIQVWSESQDGRVRVFVRDKGVGIPEGAHGKIFGIFQRAHESSYEGTGIGLAIVKRAVERMNGKTGFESRAGEGSTFWIELPAAKPPL